LTFPIRKETVCLHSHFEVHHYTILMMKMISMEKLTEESSNSATYVIEIQDFRKKLVMAQLGKEVNTKEFYINWSSFKIGLYIAGESRSSKDHLGVSITNCSDWMVRARREISVKNEVFSSSKEAGVVLKSKNGRLGRSNCVPHNRCTTGDLLSHDGTLTLTVKVELLAENIPGGRDDGGVQRQLQDTNEQLSGLKRKLDCQDIELANLKFKVKMLGPEEDNIIECPVCIRVVERPMRLQQCPKGHIICDDCHLQLQTSAAGVNKKLCVTCRCEKYCGRPSVLESVLGLLDNNI